MILSLLGPRAFACVEGSYAVVDDRLRACELAGDGSSAYQYDPQNMKLMDFLDNTLSDKEVDANYRAVSRISPREASERMNRELSGNHYRTKLTASPAPTATLERLATQINEYFGYDGAVVYQANRAKAEAARVPVANPMSDLDRWSQRNTQEIASLNRRCPESPKSEGEVRAVEMVYPGDGHRQNVVPIALSFADGAKDHGKFYYVGRDGIRSAAISRRNDKMFIKDPKTKRESEVVFNVAPPRAVPSAGKTPETRGELCVVADLARRGEVKEAAAAGPQLRIKPAKKAEAADAAQ